MLNIQSYMYTNSNDYVVMLDDEHYYLDVENNILWNKDKNIKITENDKNDIIENCLSFLPF